MENKDKAIIAGTVLTLSVLGLSLYEVVKHDAVQHNETAEAALQRQHETRPPTPQDVGRSVLDLLTSDDELQRMGAVAQLSEMPIDPAQREALAEALIRAHDLASEEEGREDIGRVLIGKVGGARAAHFALERLGSSSETVRSYAAQALVTGATRGADLRDKALELARNGGLRDQDKPGVLRRFLGKKAEPELLELLRADVSPEALRAAMIEVQNLDKPELMAEVLARCEQQGWLGDDKRMPWLSGRLLNEHIKTASKGELVRAVAAVKARPSLAKLTAKAVRQRLTDQDPDVRELLAQVTLEDDPVAPEAPSSAEAPVEP